MSDNWTPELQKEWDKTWSEPHMVRGMRELKERTRLKGVIGISLPGYDQTVLAAGHFYHASGQSNVLDIIEDMRREINPSKEFDPSQMFVAPQNRNLENRK